MVFKNWPGIKRIAHNTTCRVSRIVKKKRQNVTVGKEILQIVVVEIIVKLKKKRRIGKLYQKILSKRRKNDRDPLLAGKNCARFIAVFSL